MSSDMDLSLALIVCPDAHLPGESLHRTAGSLREPTEAQTGAIWEIDIVLMAPQAPRHIAAKP